jgi:hypothetical protein
MAVILFPVSGPALLTAKGTLELMVVWLPNCPELW